MSASITAFDSLVAASPNSKLSSCPDAFSARVFSGKKRGYYPAQIVDNKGGYKVQYLDDDGELIADEIEENVVVTRIRRPKKRPKKAGEEPPESDEEAD